jgi:hypothetical protein
MAMTSAPFAAFGSSSALRFEADNAMGNVLSTRRMGALNVGRPFS